MTFFLAALLLIALGVILIPVLVLLLQAAMALPALRAAPPAAGRRPRIAVLVPAHNEQAGVGATVACLRPQLQEGDRMLVIADNCSDGTAEAAAMAGAEVRERTDPAHRGKGYALDFGVRCLAEDPPEVLIIVDADCLVTQGAIDRLARTSHASGRPAQALYLMRAPAGAGLMQKIAEFAWIVKNLVRPLGFHRLGLPCQLTGSGMAFPWQTISSASLANGHLVEDMKLGLDLAKAGAAPCFCPQAMVYSTFPASAAGAKSQRARWEHGHIGMILSEAPALLAAGLRQPALIALALDLCVPPLALLALLALALSSGAALFALATGVAAPLFLAALVLAALGTAVLMAWWRHGRQTLGARDLALAVAYMFWKVPLYLRFFVNRQVQWVRSKRDGE